MTRSPEQCTSMMHEHDACASTEGIMQAAAPHGMHPHMPRTYARTHLRRELKAEWRIFRNATRAGGLGEVIPIDVLHELGNPLRQRFARRGNCCEPV